MYVLPSSEVVQDSAAYGSILPGSTSVVPSGPALLPYCVSRVYRLPIIARSLAPQPDAGSSVPGATAMLTFSGPSSPPAFDDPPPDDPLL